MAKASWQPGGVIGGEWRLVRELGRGGMGVVYEAVSESGRRVALKTLLGSASPLARERFRREAEGQGRADGHRNVVRIHSVGVHEELPYLVTELLTGGTLSERLKLSGRLDPPQAIEIVSALADGLAHMHAQGILHRDIKPANVLFDELGTPKLADFGLAKLPDAQTLTQTGALLGTVGYLAPEMVDEAHRAGPAADVYSLGALLFTCLAGKPPLKAATTQFNRIMALLKEPAPLLRTQREDAPEALELICARALERDPAARYPSAASLAEALRGSSQLPEGGASRVALVLASLLVLAGLLGGAGFALTPPAVSPVASPSASAAPSAETTRPPETTWRLPQRGELRYRVKWREIGFAGAESRTESVIVLGLQPLDATRRRVEARWEFSEFASVRNGQRGGFVAASDLAQAKDFVVFKGDLDLQTGAWEVHQTPDSIREELRRRVDPDSVSRSAHARDKAQTDSTLWAGTWASSFFDARRLPRLLEILFTCDVLSHTDIGWRERPGLDRLRARTAGMGVIYPYLWSFNRNHAQERGARRQTTVEGERFRADGLPTRVSLTQHVELTNGKSAQDVLEIELLH